MSSISRNAAFKMAKSLGRCRFQATVSAPGQYINNNNNINHQSLSTAAAMSMSSSPPSSSTFGSSQMQVNEYQQSSHNQYSSHDASFDLLHQSVQRVTRNAAQTATESVPQQVWVDLGSADGTNSLSTIQQCLQASDHAQHQHPLNIPHKIHVTFSEHPDSDADILQRNIQQAAVWQQYPRHSHAVHMQSFYEPVFPNNSVDLALSHICVHWLDRSNVNDLMEWKRLNNPSLSTEQLQSFTSVNDATCPPSVRQAWQQHLAIPHLSRFWQLRARELKVGGECFVTMPAFPHQFVSPIMSNGNGDTDEQPGILTRALQECVARGQVDAQVLERTIVPCYLRTVPEVVESFHQANRALLAEESTTTVRTTPTPQLELVNVRSDLTITGGNTNGNGEDTIQSTANLFWSIMAGSVRAAGLLPAEEVPLKNEIDRLFQQHFAHKGVEGHFIAATVRRVA